MTPSRQSFQPRQPARHSPHPRRYAALPGTVLAALLGGCGGGGDADPDAAAAERREQALAVAVAPKRDLVVQVEQGGNIAALAAAFDLQLMSQFGSRPIYRLRTRLGTDRDAIVAQLLDENDVRFAEAVGEHRTPEGTRNAFWAIGSAGEYRQQWAGQALRLPQAHSITKGGGVRVAVLDTGIDLVHPSLAPKLAQRQDGSVLGRDFVDDDEDPTEVGRAGDAGWGHGTHVSGLVSLIAPGARLMPVRVLDRDGRGNAWVLAEALAWAVDPDGNPRTDDGAHVINLSLGGTRPTELLKAVVGIVSCEAFDDDDDDGDFSGPGFADDRERCRRGRGAAVVAAAGNNGSDSIEIFPAAEDVKGSRAITASNRQRSVAPFANWGGWIKMAAPGQGITSTVPGGSWGTWSGTSMAAPLAAGTAALVLNTLPPGGDPSLPTRRQWGAEDLLKRVEDRMAALCDSSIKQIDAAAAVRDTQAPDPSCS